MLNNAHKRRTGTVAALIGFATLLFAASGVFGEFRNATNTIWKVQPGPARGMLGFVKDRFVSFAMVLGTGFLLPVPLMLSMAVAAMSNYITRRRSCTSGQSSRRSTPVAMADASNLPKMPRRAPTTKSSSTPNSTFRSMTMNNSPFSVPHLDIRETRPVCSSVIR